jgi:hypothetical protein
LNKTTIALSVLFVALAAAAFYLHTENRELKAEFEQISLTLAALRADNDQLKEQVEDVRSKLDDVRVASESALAICDTEFPSGLYRLVTDTNYGAVTPSEYEIYHASVPLAEWRIDVGTRLNSFGLPTDFYFDYDGDGRIDTALAARLVRELPIGGNAIADRLLADSRIHQNLYAVFSCEWRNAEYTSADDMNDKVTGTSNMLWELVQQHSRSIVEWIRAQ